jgi:hypothetical protein
MKILGILILLQLLSPTADVRQAGLWAHYQDTLVITNTKMYYTNAEAIFYMCGATGTIENDYLKGSCSVGAKLELRSTATITPKSLITIDTLFVITTDRWTPYTRVPFDIVEIQKSDTTTKNTQPRKYW